MGKMKEGNKSRYSLWNFFLKVRYVTVQKTGKHPLAKEGGRWGR